MKSRILITLLLFLLTLSLPAQSVRLYGHAADYAGLNVSVETYGDFISHHPRSIGTLHFDSQGNFSDTLDLDATAFVFLDVGALRASAYLMPNADYEVVMPPFTPRPDSERFNPFFVPEEVQLGLVNDSSQLNFSIRSFDQFYDSLYQNHAARLVRSHDKVLTDSLLLLCDSAAHVQPCTDEFFARHVRGRRQLLYSLPRLRSVRQLTRDCFAVDSVDFVCPSYWEAFNMVYQDFLPTYARLRGTNPLKSLLATNSFDFSQMRDALLADSLFSDTAFCETVLVKSIYDAAYSGYFAEQRADTLLVMAAMQASDSHLRPLVDNIILKRIHLKVGSDAPDFTLLDTKGKEVSLASLHGKFVYLAFLHTGNYQCQKTIPTLSSVGKKYRRDVTVVGIMTDEDADALEDRFDLRKINWIPLSFNMQQSVVLDYSIASLPTFFIINPDGKLAVVNAPGPEENLQQVFAEEIQKYKREKQQNAPNNVKDIYDLVREAQYK